MTIEFNTGCALVSVYGKVCFHFGVKRDEYTVYKGHKVVDCDWIWGRATEQYDHSLEYFGLGPLLLVVW